MPECQVIDHVGALTLTGFHSRISHNLYKRACTMDRWSSGLIPGVGTEVVRRGDGRT
jgi:hypothetical protein